MSVTIPGACRHEHSDRRGVRGGFGGCRSEYGSIAADEREVSTHGNAWGFGNRRKQCGNTVIE